MTQDFQNGLITGMSLSDGITVSGVKTEIIDISNYMTSKNLYAAPYAFLYKFGNVYTVKILTFPNANIGSYENGYSIATGIPNISLPEQFQCISVSVVHGSELTVYYAYATVDKGDDSNIGISLVINADASIAGRQIYIYGAFIAK